MHAEEMRRRTIDGKSQITVDYLHKLMERIKTKAEYGAWNLEVDRLCIPTIVGEEKVIQYFQDWGYEVVLMGNSLDIRWNTPQIAKYTHHCKGLDCSGCDDAECNR